MGRKKKTNEEFVKEVYELTIGEYVFLEEYINNKTKIKCRHNKCGYEWNVIPSNFLKGSRCPECAKIIVRNANTLTYKEVKHFIEVESGSRCKLLSEEYVSNITRLKLLCKCGDEFETSFNDFKSSDKRQCNKCGYQNTSKSNMLTYEEVKQFIEVESDSGCKLLSDEYKGNKNKLEFQCKCGSCFKTTLDSFKRGKRQCDLCRYKIAGDKRRKTNKEFTKEVYDLVDNEYIFLEEYISANKKINCKHNICGHIWKISPNTFLNSGTRCPECSTHRRTDNRFKKEVFDLVGDEYIFLEKYQSTKDKIKCRHNICGYEWSVSPSNFLHLSTRCPKCSGRYTKSNDEFIQEIYDLVGDEYMFLEGYTDTSTPILCKHNECGYEWNVIPSNFITKGSRCPKCSGSLKKSHQEFCSEIYNLVGDEYDVIGEYIARNVKIEFKHSKCGHIWSALPSGFLAGRRCPQCNESKGEQSVRNHLEKDNIKFQQEHSFDGLLGVGSGLLRFDFAIFDKSNNLQMLIEYDGEFHFDKYYEEQNYETTQIHDKRKNQYCKDNNIPLIRIPYWQFDKIEQILNKWLSKYGLIFK